MILNLAGVICDATVLLHIKLYNLDSSSPILFFCSTFSTDTSDGLTASCASCVFCDLALYFTCLKYNGVYLFNIYFFIFNNDSSDKFTESVLIYVI